MNFRNNFAYQQNTTTFSADQQGCDLWGEGFVKLSTVSKAILISAEQLAISTGGDLLKWSHIIQSMLELEVSPISSLFRSAGVDPEKLHLECTRLNFIGLVRDSLARRDARPLLNPELRAVIRTADRLARSVSAQLIEPQALLLGLFESCSKLKLATIPDLADLRSRLRLMTGMR